MTSVEIEHARCVAVLVFILVVHTTFVERQLTCDTRVLELGVHQFIRSYISSRYESL